MSDDIVTRLLDYDFLVPEAPPYFRELIRRAAHEIEQLRFERDGLRDGTKQTLAALADANEIAKRYKAERDQARRLFCKLDAEMYGHFGDKERLVVHRASYLPCDAAKKRGWDCFKEKP